MYNMRIEREILQVGLFGKCLGIDGFQVSQAFKNAHSGMANKFGDALVPKSKSVFIVDHAYGYHFVRVAKPWARMQGGLVLRTHPDMISIPTRQRGETLDIDELFICVDSLGFMRRSKQARWVTGMADAALEALVDTEPWTDEMLIEYLIRLGYDALMKGGGHIHKIALTSQAGTPILRGKPDRSEARRQELLGEITLEKIAELLESASAFTHQTVEPSVVM